jgi:hypothetical protein
MDLIEMIRVTGSLPSVAQMNDGTKLQLFIRKKTGNKGYIAILWQIVDGGQENIFEYGTGKTVDDAKTNLKNKLLSVWEKI